MTLYNVATNEQLIQYINMVLLYFSTLLYIYSSYYLEKLHNYVNAVVRNTNKITYF